MSARATMTTLGVLLIASACGGGVTQDTGLEADLRVASGQYYAGPLPGAHGGPVVKEIASINNTVHPGQIAKKLGGSVGPGSTAVAFFLDGDPGYWIRPTGVEDVLNPGNLTFDARLTFAPGLVVGDRDLLVSAVDADGHFGEPSRLTLHVAAAGAPTTPAILDVALSWDTESDLDLHLEIPGGVIVWARNLNSYVPPPPPGHPDPVAAAAGGILDFDSNSGCLIDGRREEHVVWTAPPPSGHYVVRVDAFSLCGQADAYWKTQVTLNGTALGTSRGEAVDQDTKIIHDEKAGVLALEFDVP